MFVGLSVCMPVCLSVETEDCRLESGDRRLDPRAPVAMMMVGMG